jgi:Double zinc ribbon
VALIDQGDVDRLFRGLVAVLAERDPARLERGFEVAELYQDLVPYRTHRNQLGFATNQDYEGAVLGLLAGLGGFATVEPVEAQETLASEAASPNPDPTLFREFAAARVRLNRARVRSLLEGDAAYAPREPEPPPTAAPATPPAEAAALAPVFELATEEPSPPATPLAASTGARCTGCDAALPTDRPVVFCPFCGRAVGRATCARCGDELAPSWRFCPRCGAAR